MIKLQSKPAQSLKIHKQSSVLEEMTTFEAINPKRVQQKHEEIHNQELTEDQKPGKKQVNAIIC